MDLLRDSSQVWITNPAAWKGEAEVVRIKSCIHLLFKYIY